MVTRLAGTLGLAVVLGVAACESRTPQAEIPSQPGEWYQSASYVWALQTADLAKRKERSAPWRDVVADGASAPANIDWKLLAGDGTWTRAELSLASGPDKSAFWRQEARDHTKPAALPSLPRGGYWLTVKVFDEGLLRSRKFFLNVLESSEKELPSSATAGLRVEAGDRAVSVSGWPGGAPTLRLEVVSLVGDAISSRDVPVPAGEKSITIPIPEAVPGQTVSVAVSVLADGKVKDREEIWLATRGDYPARPVWEPSANPPSIFDYLMGETIATQEPFDSQVEGVKKQLDTMADRGSSSVQIWVTWGRIEAMGGACDWSQLDAYVNAVTERKIPFVLAAAGSVLFGNGPAETWGEWMVNHEGKFKLWRKTPVVSSSSTSYLTSAREFTRRMIERYKDNPYLAGYCFLNSGMDSGIFQDHYDSVTDYSAVARGKFREFLRGRYESLAALNTAWGTHWRSWDDILPPMPKLAQEVNLERPWQDWTQWKLGEYRSAAVDLFDPLVAELDPARPVIHYNAKTGPFEYQFRDLHTKLWATADGAGEDYRMGRINSMTHNWGLWRQTESHEVPPANLAYMTDMWAESLRTGGGKIRYNLVFNTLPKLFLKGYPENVELQKTLMWWKDTAALRETLSQCSSPPQRTGVILSWADMLYRVRVWRWYAMAGDRADAMIRERDLLPASWISEWTPESAWAGLTTILVPEDVRVWTPELTARLAAFVERGGHLVVWGQSGKYDLDGNTYSWPRHLGAPGLTVSSIPPEPKPAVTSASVAGKSLQLAPAARVDNLPEGMEKVVDALGRPVVLTWKFGQGSVRWCLSETPGESERAIAVLLEEAGAVREVTSSDPRTDAFLLENGAQRYVVLNRFLGFGKKDAGKPASATVRLPRLEAGKTWQIHPLLPAGEPFRSTSESLASEGWSAEVAPSGMLVYEITAAK